MKKIICCFLAVLMFLLGTTSVHAEGITDNYESNSVRLVQASNGQEDIPITDLQNLVRANVYEQNEIVVTTGFTVYNADTDVIFKLLPVLANDEYVGIIHIGSENAFSFSANTEILEAIEDLNFDTYLLYVCDGIYYAESEGECVSLVATGFTVDENADFDLLSFEQKVEVLLGKSDVAIVEYFDIFQESFLVNTQMNSRAAVPAVDSESCAISKFMEQNADNCWAACIATIVNYKNSSSISAKYVSNASGITGTATANQTRNVLNNYSLSYNLTYSKISWARVKNCISADYPFIIGLTGGNLGHMITGYGYSCTHGDPESDIYSRYVKAWDPNGYKISFGYYSTYVTTSGYNWTWGVTIYDN